MRLLLDTNVILRLANERTSEHTLVQEVLERVVATDEPVIVPQCLYEFWSTCTRPVHVNGFGWEADRTRLEVERLLRTFPLISDLSEVFRHWLELVTTHSVAGKQVHDARLAAAVLAHSFDYLLTLNGDDFKRFSVRTVHPRDVSA